jgi:hypothetical protein
MAAANDNQGLKIAVAALVMLVFILGVTNYFAFSSASQMTAKADSEATKARDAEKNARARLDEANFMRTAIGYPNIDDLEALKAQMLKDFQRISNNIQEIGTESTNAINEVQKSGAPDPKLDELKQVAVALVGQFQSEPNENKVYVKSLDRLKDLLTNLSRQMRELSLDYLKLRRDLESANSINAVEVAKVGGARDKAVQEQADQLARIKTELQELYDQITNLQNSEKDKTNAITDLTTKLTDANNKYDIYRRDVQKSLQDLRDRASLKMTEFASGQSIGRISHVDYARGEARVDISKSTGARPMMAFTIFDADARGLPNDKPKGTIELVNVGDNDSLARIVETKDSTNPIRRYDQLYSPSFTPSNPQRYALVGKIDLNHDGRDDRADLIRLIEQSGGMVEYDLPPPGVDRTPGNLAVSRTFAKLNEPVPPVTGRASGRISPLARAYVIDDWVQPGRERMSDLTADAVDFAKARTEATKEARLNGVPPMPLSRLVAYLGYTPPTDGGVPPGNLEMKNKTGLKMLLKPRVATPGGAATPGAPGAAAKPKGDAPKGDMPKDQP